MIISLIGMSGSGKTFWSNKLAKLGFEKICCDDLIEEKLSGELKKLGFSGIADVSKWMGQPYEKRYNETSKKYLELEQKVMEEVLDNLKNKKDSIIDTTGSVIYVSQKILEILKKKSQIIYLKVPQEVEDEMFKLYLQDPKPVIWGSSFNKRPGELDLDSLKRCYPRLLKYRSKQYQNLADLTLTYADLRSEDFDARLFLKLISI